MLAVLCISCTLLFLWFNFPTLGYFTFIYINRQQQPFWRKEQYFSTTPYNLCSQLARLIIIFTPTPWLIQPSYLGSVLLSQEIIRLIWPCIPCHLFLHFWNKESSNAGSCGTDGACESIVSNMAAKQAFTNGIKQIKKTIWISPQFAPEVG